MLFEFPTEIVLDIIDVLGFPEVLQLRKTSTAMARATHGRLVALAPQVFPSILMSAQLQPNVPAQQVELKFFGISLNDWSLDNVLLTYRQDVIRIPCLFLSTLAPPRLRVSMYGRLLPAFRVEADVVNTDNQIEWSHAYSHASYSYTLVHDSEAAILSNLQVTVPLSHLVRPF